MASRLRADSKQRFDINNTPRIEEDAVRTFPRTVGQPDHSGKPSRSGETREKTRRNSLYLGHIAHATKKAIGSSESRSHSCPSNPIVPIPTVRRNRNSESPHDFRGSRSDPSRPPSNSHVTRLSFVPIGPLPSHASIVPKRSSGIRNQRFLRLARAVRRI